MIFFLNANGVLLKSVPSRVFQGSNNANTIYVVAPVNQNAVASVRFILPNGTYTEQGIMALNTETEIGITDGNGNLYYAWTYDVPSVITAEAGQVQCQIVFTNGLQTITSDGITFTVEKGVPPIEIENISTADELLNQLAIIQQTLNTITNSTLPDLNNQILNKLDKAPTNDIPLIDENGKIDDSYLPEVAIEGAVTSINRIEPDADGNVDLSADSVGAVPLDPIPDEPLIDENDKINTTYLPDYILGQMIYGGTFVQDQNPTDILISLTNAGASKLVSAGLSESISNDQILGSYIPPAGAEGIYFISSANGITFSGITFETGDWLVSTANGWTKIDNTDAVQSVNGKTGAVVLIARDVGAVPENQYASETVAGVVKVNDNNSGLQVQTKQASLGQLRLYIASPTVMSLRTGYRSSNNINYSECAPISAGNMDLALKYAITGNAGGTLGNQLPLTDEERASVQAWLGISASGGTQLYKHEITGSFYDPQSNKTYYIVGGSFAISTRSTSIMSENALVDSVKFRLKVAESADGVLYAIIDSIVTHNEAGAYAYSGVDNLGNYKSFASMDGITIESDTITKL